MKSDKLYRKYCSRGLGQETEKHTEAKHLGVLKPRKQKISFLIKSLVLIVYSFTVFENRAQTSNTNKIKQDSNVCFYLNLPHIAKLKIENPFLGHMSNTNSKLWVYNWKNDSLLYSDSTNSDANFYLSLGSIQRFVVPGDTGTSPYLSFLYSAEYAAFEDKLITYVVISTDTVKTTEIDLKFEDFGFYKINKSKFISDLYPNLPKKLDIEEIGDNIKNKYLNLIGLIEEHIFPNKLIIE